MSQNEIIKTATTRFGEIEAKPEQTMHLPLGMIGFPHLHRYLLFPHRADSPFFWLQSMDRPDLAFVLTNPLLFEPNYQITLSNSDRKLLELSDPNQIQVWVVVTIPHGSPESMTANLKAPVAVNLSNRIMAQIILENSDYPLKKSIKKEA
jgi:flagellar assembly factor FliW